IINSTIADNYGGGRSTEGGGLLTSEGTISIENSIVAFNTVDEPLTGNQVDSNCGGAGITSLRYNLHSGGNCGFNATGDISDEDPRFQNGLQDNGGNTDTLALSGESAAIDAIPTSAPNCGSNTDQRDLARPQGAGCDIGAFELFQPVEGQQFSEVVGVAAPQEGTTPTINWGDGTGSPGALDPNTHELTGTHTYTEAGIYHASFTFTNSDGFPQTVPFDVKVQDAPLSATGADVNATVGTQFSDTVATFTDA